MERLFPGDEIGVIGTDEQVKIFAEYLRQNEIEIPEKVDTEVVLRQIELNNEQFIGKAIGRSKLRELTQGLVVGIERNGVRMLNPESNIILEKDDILWIVGNKKLLNQTFVER
jgi:CPA2 family monovalent cation:H+ antiporter-2